MSSSNQFHRLSDDEWKELQKRADQFAEALGKGTAGDWQTFLEDLGGRMRLAVLGELVKIDLEHRWSRGEKPLIDEYVTRFPELGPLHVVPVDLICEEYRLRRKHNQHPSREEYKERFPAQYDAVIREIERERPESPKSVGMNGSVKANTVVSDAEDAKQAAEDAAKQLPEFGASYQKIELIGEGHFAEVWRAKAPDGIEVAIKVVRQPVDRDAAQRELGALEIVKNLRHPCLLATFRFWIQDRRLHIAMELADGTLRNRLKQCKKQGQPGVPRDELLMYFADAAEGLDFLHSHKVFHRDIKPDNIMLLQGHAKVADFGLARLQERQMATVSFAGTPVYMAPEAWGGKGGPRSDQYSLAFAYAELRQGKRPVEGEDFTTVMSRVLEGEPDFSGIPHEEVKILRRAMSKRPEDRFASCSEFMAAMARATGTPVRTRTAYEAALVGRGSDASDDRTYKEPSSENINLGGGGRKKFALAAVLLLLLSGAGFGVWNFFIKNGTKPTGQQQQNNNVVQGPRTDLDPKTNNSQVEKKDPPVVPLSPFVVIEPFRKGGLQAIANAARCYVPPRFQPDPDAKIVNVGQRLVAERIVFPFGNEKAVFILLRPVGGRPYYFMQNKVWCSFLRAFDKEKPGKLDGEKWKTDPDKWPAFDLSVTAAHAFAEWLGGKYGKLPTVEQWDFAAGIQDRMGKPGPNRHGKPAVGLTEPRPVDAKERDEGPFGILDLSGNGREYTRDVKRGDIINHVPLRNPTEEDEVIIRGRDYTFKTPLSYGQIDDWIKTPTARPYAERDKLTSFRVVVEIPD